MNELYAYPGRGGLLVYALDENGERIPLKEGEEDDEQKKQRLGNTRRPRPGGGGMGGGDGGRRPAEEEEPSPGPTSTANRKPNAGSRRRRKANALAGGGIEDTKEPPRPRPRRRRAAALTRKSPRAIAGWRSPALLTTARCSPITRRHSRTPPSPTPIMPGSTSSGKLLQPDGTWSDWQNVDAKKNLEILDNIPENGRRTGSRDRAAREPRRSAPLPQGRLMGEGPHRLLWCPRKRSKRPSRTMSTVGWAAWGRHGRNAWDGMGCHGTGNAAGMGGGMGGMGRMGGEMAGMQGSMMMRGQGGDDER